MQDVTDDITPEELTAMDESITTLREEIAAAKTQEKALKSELGAFSNILSTADLRTSVAALEAETLTLQGRLRVLEAGDSKPVSDEEKDAVESAWVTWEKHTRARKKICKEMWDRCTEVMPEDQSKDELWVGIPGPRIPKISD